MALHINWWSECLNANVPINGNKKITWSFSCSLGLLTVYPFWAEYFSTIVFEYWCEGLSKVAHSVWCLLFYVWLVFSAKPQEYKARLEKRHEAKNEVLGHSKQAEFIRLMEQEVEYQPGRTINVRRLNTATFRRILRHILVGIRDKLRSLCTETLVFIFFLP